MGKKSAPPPPPDYVALAKQQGDLNKEAAVAQTTVNRPNQVTPWGETTWAQGPNDTWTQNVTLNAEDQARLDQDRALQGQQQNLAGNLMTNVGDTLSTPINMNGLPGMSGYDLSKLAMYDPNSMGQGLSARGQIDTSGLSALPDSGFGAVQQVQDAMMGRLAPGRAQSREAEIQRLKNQGIPEDSDAFQRAMTRLDQGDTDASQQALLGATSAYGDIFNRGLAARQQGFGEQSTKADLANQNRTMDFGQNQATQNMLQALRGQQFGEQGAQAQLSGQQRQQGLAEQTQMRDQPLNDYMRLINGTTPTMPTMPSFMGGTNYNAADVYGGAKDAYNAEVANVNAANANKSSTVGGLMKLGGTLGAAFL